MALLILNNKTTEEPEISKLFFINISILIILAIFILPQALISYNLDRDTLDPQESILINHSGKKLAPVEYFTKDTLFNKTFNEDDFNKPGISYDIKYSAAQNSIYYRAMRLKIPASVRLNNDFKLFTGKRQIEREIEKGLPWQVALDNLRIRPEILAPLPQDIVHRQEMKDRALYVPFMPNLQRDGISISLQDIGILLGVLEDVSPVIKFDLNYTEEVEIVIYSVQAVVVATVFKGLCQSGHNKYVWNGRDDKGRPMPPGDYIGEVRIGKIRFERKRITLP
ncbi:FlgD immunoglobulin-like domain containing protein [Bacteroidota bacterium]